MTTEKLIIELDAKTGKLDATLKATDKNLDSLDKSTQKTDKSLMSIGKTAGAAAGVVAKVSTAALAAASAITAMAVASAKGYKEMALLSSQAKLNVEDFKALSFATAQYGVNAENIADISKDLSDKLGEFSSAGTGAFQDFIDVMGMTKDEGMALSREFENMSSDQVIGEMVRRMEGAGATTNQMTWALESMGNDLSKLLPLFSNNSSELNKLTSSFNEANKSMAITATQASDLAELSTGFDLMIQSAGNAATSISATLAPVLTSFFDDVIAIIPQAEQAIVDFINRFVEVESLNSINAVNEEFERNTEIIKANQWAQDQLEAKVILTGAAQDAQIKALNEYNEAQQRAEELIFRRIELEEDLEAKLLADAKSPKGKPEGGGTGGAVDHDAIEQLRDRFKTEEDLLTEKYEREMELARGNQNLLLELENEYIENLMALDEANILKRAEASRELWLETIAAQNQEKFDNEIAEQQRLLSEKLINEESYLKSVYALGVKYGKTTEKDVKKINEEKKKSDLNYAETAMGASTALFGHNKDVKSANVVVDSAAGIQKAFADLPYPAAVGASIQIAASGIAQLAAINSASPGGGGSSPSSSPSSSSGASSSPGFSSSVEVNETVGSGANTSTTSNVITFSGSSSDTVGQAMAEWLNNAIASGEIKLGQ